MRLADVTRRPVRLRLAEGEAHDGRSVAGMFETVRVGRVRPAGRACDGDALRMTLVNTAHGPDIRTMQGRVRTFPLSRPCRLRKIAECLFSGFRHLSFSATHHDKREDNILASVQTVSVRIWLKSHEPVN